MTANDIVNLPNLFQFDAIDADEAVRRALSAFDRNGFMLFADGRQMTGLDDTIAIRPQTEAIFIRLIPLKGG